MLFCTNFSIVREQKMNKYTQVFSEFTSKEKFEFCCVSDRENIEKLLSYYKINFTEYGFDGMGKNQLNCLLN